MLNMHAFGQPVTYTGSTRCLTVPDSSVRFRLGYIRLTTGPTTDQRLPHEVIGGLFRPPRVVTTPGCTGLRKRYLSLQGQFDRLFASRRWSIEVISDTRCPSPVLLQTRSSLHRNFTPPAGRRTGRTKFQPFDATASRSGYLLQHPVSDHRSARRH